MNAHAIFKVYLVVMYLLGIAGNIWLIGKERKPLTPGVAAISTVWAMANLYGLLKFL